MDLLINNNITQRIREDNCFDFLRFFFATILIISHFCVLTENNQLLPLTGGDSVRAFFTITGFLVTYSFLRRNCNIVSYAKRRFARILPAYIATIIFCMLTGWLVTSLDAKEFWSSGQTWRYFFANILMLNWIEPELPNTFQTNTMPQMDGSLWVMKQEVIFYLLVPFIIFLMKRFGKAQISIALMTICIAIYPIVNIQTKLFTFFISGMVIMLFFDLYNKYFNYILAISFIMFFFPELALLAFPIVLIAVAYHCRFLNCFCKLDNITYGLFLYHFPVIQTLVHYGVAEYSLTLCFVMTIIITSFLATISWFCIEKPIMSRCA